MIPPELTPEQIAYTYASEADLLNVALFGQTAKQWKNNNPSKKGNVRDDANLNQLLEMLDNCMQRWWLATVVKENIFVYNKTNMTY